jgi:hypothetical protein
VTGSFYGSPKVESEMEWSIEAELLEPAAPPETAEENRNR